MEKVEKYILAFLFGALLLLTAMGADAMSPKDDTLDPDTCQEEGTCWIPAGGKPQPILAKVEKGTFNSGYTSGTAFLVPGTPKGDNHLLWLVVIEEWYGPWCLKHQNERSYFKCLQGIVFESRGNPYGITNSSVWLEMGLTSANDGFAAEYDFDPCGDPETCIWASSAENHGRRRTIAEGEQWDWLDGHSRLERERWLSATGSVNGGVVLRMAKDANAHKVTPETVEGGGVTPWKRFIGALRKWDKSGIIYAKKAGISITPWRLGIRLGRKISQEKRYPMISWRPDPAHHDESEGGVRLLVPVSKKAAKERGIEPGVVEVVVHDDLLGQIAEEYYTTVPEIVSLNAQWSSESMCYSNHLFYDPSIELPQPKAKAPFPGSKLAGKKCKKHKKEWRAKLGKTLAQASQMRRGSPEFEELQAQGWFPSDEEYEWWEENIGQCKVADSIVVRHLLHKIGW